MDFTEYVIFFLLFMLCCTLMCYCCNSQRQIHVLLFHCGLAGRARRLADKLIN